MEFKELKNNKMTSNKDSENRKLNSINKTIPENSHNTVKQFWNKSACVSKNSILLCCLSGILFCLSACELWDKDHLFSYIEAQDGVFIHDCSSYTDWHFFSFAEGEVIGSCDAMDSVAYVGWYERKDWDLAFHRQNVKSNSGISGSGTGGIMEYPQNVFDFDAVIEAPETGYLTDIADSVVYDMSQMAAGSIGYAYTGVNPETKGWAVLTDMMGGVWTYAQKVFVVRTADNKYAKIHLMNFKDRGGVSGTVTMRYVYQSDGSLSFKFKN